MESSEQVTREEAISKLAIDHDVMLNGDDLMREAWQLTNGDRRTAYGDPAEVFTAYGWAWSAILAPKLKSGAFIDAADATLMMAALKICREAHKIKRDNVVDGHGYLSLHSRVTGLLKP